jgi:acetyl-CoA carboxylase biotin carboxyl carrier protein
VSLSYDEISEILKLIDNSSCDELIVETADMKLVVRRNGASPTSAAKAEYTTRTPGPAATPQSVVREARNAPMKVVADPGQIEVVAPMVGTFYRAPNPESAPFVEIGSVVRKGQPLCLIEVMKLFTTINSEVAGRIVQIGAENTELVEYGRTLFVIEPV